MGSHEIIFSVLTKYSALFTNFSVKVGESLGSIVGHDQFSVRFYDYVSLRLKLKFVKIQTVLSDWFKQLCLSVSKV